MVRFSKGVFAYRIGFMKEYWLEWVGGNGGMVGGSSMTFTNSNTQIKMTGASQGPTTYGNNGYPATNAFSNGSKFTHTNRGVGMWW
jgi:hypothetical protein